MGVSMVGREDRRAKRRQRHLAITQQPTPDVVPLTQRGPMLFVDDIQSVYGKKPDGKWRKSARWVREYFAPEFRRYLGRTPYWYEADATAWLDAQSRKRPARREDDDE